jgi:meso-butanediol dehydrogenase / (S,S)-butanediol dehydrogenase / diacetyl reductase
MERLMNRFEGKGAIVTGGSSGIGAATVRRLVTEGACVVLSDVNRNDAQLMELGASAHFIACDVADPDAVESMIRDGHEWLGRQHARLDILFNNAGIGSIGETPDLTVEAWRRVIDVDLNAVFYGCRVAIPLMKAAGGGAIINTASISGLFGDYGFSAYNAAKGAVVNYTRTLALDHGKDKIRVNALCPGLIRTGLTTGLELMPDLLEQWQTLIPLARAGTPEEMAAVVLFLASDDASYITGATVVADGGMTTRTGQPNVTRFVTG